jgi:hypothetical protein
MLNIPSEYDKDISSAKFKDISRQRPALLLAVCCTKRALVDESRMIGIQMGTDKRS